MTAQISDLVKFQDSCFQLVGINGTGMFDPKAHGLSPERATTACWRGYFCTYKVAADELRLDELRISLGAEDGEAVNRGEGIHLFGKLPTQNVAPEDTVDQLVWEFTRWPEFNYVYEHVGGKIPFTGGLLIGSGFIQEMYVHMGFHPAYKYRYVGELIFDHGTLTKATDRSPEMAEFRESLASNSLKPADTDDLKKLQQWIQKSFSLDYKW